MGNRCLQCNEELPAEVSFFCDPLCQEMWVEYKRVEMLVMVLNKIFDEEIGVINANTRPS